MIGIEIDVKGDTTLLASLGGLRGQMPYATSVALNNLADDAQSAIRATLPGHFHLRRADFIDRTIYIANQDRARKDKLAVTVRVNPKRNFLAKFEDGGQKTGQHALAVPIMRQDNLDLIISRGDPLAVKKLMNAIQAKQGRFRARHRKGDPKALLKAKTTVYLLKTPKGTFIMQRTGQQTRVLYAFERSVPIPPMLHFVDTAHAAVIAHTDARFEDAIAHAIATMR